MHFPRHRSLEESHEFARRCVACWHDGSAYPWAIVVRNTAKFVGTIEMQLQPPKASFGYILCKTSWGQGYATEASTEVVSWAIRQPGIFRVWTTCHPDNAGSARVLEKVRPYARRPPRELGGAAEYRRGRPATALVYALTRSGGG